MGTIGTGASHAVSHVSDSARSARDDLVALGVQAMKLLNAYRPHDGSGFDSVLGRIGLRRRESILRPLAFFAAGAAVGGAAVLLLSPGAVTALRGRINELLGVAGHGGGAKAVEASAGAAQPSKVGETTNGGGGAEPSRVTPQPS
jgi:hypothetical protein